MKLLQEGGSQQPSKVILPRVHRLIKQSKAKIRFDYRKLKEKLQICKKCDQWNKIKSIIQCNICEDNYHDQCIDFKEKTGFTCEECLVGKKVTNLCERCKKNVSKKEKKVCIKCKIIFHNVCLRNKKSKCRKCEKIESKQ